jgi:crossover junction endodeoxyribonuclease RuvC
MKVIGIDPGYDRLGVAVMEKADGKETLLHSTCIETSKNDTLADRIHTAGVAFQAIVDEHTPDGVALETLFFNKNVKTAVAVAQMRGVVLYIAKTAGARIFEYGPQEIKVAITGYGKSDKNAVIDMVKMLVHDAPEAALDDEYDAIAVTVTCLASEREL